MAPAAGPLDPGNDGQAQLLAGSPALPAQDIGLEQGEEGFHGGDVAAGSDAARPIRARRNTEDY